MVIVMGAKDQENRFLAGDSLDTQGHPRIIHQAHLQLTVAIKVHRELRQATSIVLVGTAKGEAPVAVAVSSAAVGIHVAEGHAVPDRDIVVDAVPDDRQVHGVAAESLWRVGCSVVVGFGVSLVEGIGRASGMALGSRRVCVWGGGDDQADQEGVWVYQDAGELHCVWGWRSAPAYQTGLWIRDLTIGFGDMKRLCFYRLSGCLATDELKQVRRNDGNQSRDQG